MAVRPRVDDEHLPLEGHRRVLPLLEDLDQPPPAGELGLRRLVEIRSELRKSGHVAELRQLEPQRPGDLLHGLRLGVAADAGHRQPDVDRWADAGVEEVGIEEDLPVGDRDDVCRDVS